MQTQLPESLLATRSGARADEILRSCVHCGFCNATCPTYQLRGDELDGPRGRIYLIKEMLENSAPNAIVQTHLDRCLTCRACETTCPSGVAYGELLEIGRDVLEQEQPRRALDRLRRSWLKRVVPDPRRFRRWLRLGRLFRPLLPARLAGQLPPLPESRGPVVPAPDSGPLVLLLDGCVQRVTTPGVNDHLQDLLHRRGVRTLRLPEEGCCGALSLHLGDEAAALAAARRNLDLFAPWLDEVEAVLSSASGCGVTWKDYGRLLAADPDYADRAQRLSRQVLDASEYLIRFQDLQAAADHRRIAWQAPCTLQHGQRLGGGVEALLRGAGYELVPVAEPHLCCGSAGTYSLLQPALSEQLRTRKLASLGAAAPDAIATANVGCQTHLAGAATVPVHHWLELLR